MKSIDFDIKRINFARLASVVINAVINVIVITGVVTVLTAVITGILGYFVVGGTVGISSVVGVIAALIANALGAIINRLGSDIKQNCVDALTQVLEHPFKVAFPN